MVDLETLGTAHDCVVLSLGAVKFDLLGNDDAKSIELNDIEEGMDDRSLYFILPPQPKRSVDQSTINWWKKQSPEARVVLDGNPTVETIAEVQHNFFKFCEETEFLWGNGNMFDNAILRNLFAPNFPYRYYQDMDYRTLKTLYMELGFTTFPSYGSIPHHALCDAKMQVLTAQFMTRMIKNGGMED